MREIATLKDKIYILEKDLTQFEQYNRRENLEISGIPESVKQNQLEEYVVDMLHRIGVPFVQHYHISACHRLKHKKFGEKYKRVIICFTNRKIVYDCLKNRHHIKKRFSNLPNAYIHESLCFKEDGQIKKLWNRNGTIFIKKSHDDNEIPTRVYHKDDIQSHFPTGNVGFI